MPAGNPSKRALVNAPLLLFAPVPLAAWQPLLHRIVSAIMRNRPELLDRLGDHRSKRFLIDPTNLPFALSLRPDPERLSLKAVPRRAPGRHDACISGTFLTLLDMVDGRLDGDALFFSRDLKVSGDTEAIVSLRNALDDMEGSVADDAAAMFGPPGRMVLRGLRAIRGRGDGA